MTDQNIIEDDEQNNDDDLQSKIRAAVEQQVGGLKTNNQALKAEKKALKEQLDKIKGESDEFSKLLSDTGMDRDSVISLLRQAQENEDMKLMAEGKVDQVVEKRVSRLKTEHGTQLANKDKMISELQAERDNLKQQINDNVISTEFSKAADQCGVIPFAKEDALLHVRQFFKLDEDGILRCYQNGEQVYGTDGSSPITPIEYLNSLKDTRPHWFSQPVGGGALGSQGRESNEYNPWAKNTFNRTEQMRMIKQDPEKAKRLQKIVAR